MGPGSDKVASGEYELFNTLDSSQTLSRSEFEGLVPGMGITMAVIVGQYGKNSLERCPRIGCKSARVTANEAGGRTWYALLRCLFCMRLLFNSSSICKSWFNLAKKSLPKPLRPPVFNFPTSSSFKYIHHRRSGFGNVEDSQSLDVYRRMRNERRAFKNIHVRFAELPETPIVYNVRGLTQASRIQKRKRKPKTQWIFLSPSTHATGPTDMPLPSLQWAR